MKQFIVGGKCETLWSIEKRSVKHKKRVLDVVHLLFYCVRKWYKCEKPFLICVYSVNKKIIQYLKSNFKSVKEALSQAENKKFIGKNVLNKDAINYIGTTGR